jgi:hypothetical protein
VNPDRLICGLATLFGTMAHSGVFWTARMFEGWLRSPITALPLRVNHSMLAIERGGLVITNSARAGCSPQSRSRAMAC